MIPTRTETKVRRGANGFLIALFCGFLTLPTLDWLLHLDDSPTPNENRVPAVFPKWPGVASDLQPFIAGLESWFNDHFGFRKTLVRLHNRWKVKLFGESPSSDVLTGRDGWLYFGSGMMIDNHLGVRLFSAEDLVSWQTLLETRRNWLEKRGIAYVFVVAPNKETIYPEHLPEWMVGSGRETKLDQLVAHMRAHSTVEVLDLRSMLIEAKKTALTYYPTDSHWNDFGAFLASRALVEVVGRQLPGGLEALSIDAFELRFVDQSPGDLARMSGEARVSSERITPRLTPRPPLEPLEAHVEESLLDPSGKAGSAPVYTERSGGFRRIVLFRDSFATAWIQFLGQHFARAVYVSRQFWSAALIEREHPDVVVDEVGERQLNEGDPRELLKLDDLPR